MMLCRVTNIVQSVARKHRAHVPRSRRTTARRRGQPTAFYSSAPRSPRSAAAPAAGRAARAGRRRRCRASTAPRGAGRTSRKRPLFKFKHKTLQRKTFRHKTLTREKLSRWFVFQRAFPNHFRFHFFRFQNQTRHGSFDLCRVAVWMRDTRQRRKSAPR